MARAWRRALWGYRLKSTNLYFQSLQERVAERCTQRDRALSQLQAEFETAEQQVNAEEAALNALQAEYFILTGELNELSMRSQRTLEAAQNQWAEREDQAYNAAQARQEFADHLSRALLSVPEEIQNLIRRVIAPLSATAPEAEPLMQASLTQNPENGRALGPSLGSSRV